MYYNFHASNETDFETLLMFLYVDLGSMWCQEPNFCFAFALSFAATITRPSSIARGRNQNQGEGVILTMDESTLDVEATPVNDESQTKTSKPSGGLSERVPGKSLFPIARVQKILKADKV